MMQASSTAKMGLLAQQTRMDVIANNLANINTAGFKTRQVNFHDMLYNTMARPTSLHAERNGQVTAANVNNLQKGTGVKVASTDLNMNNGIPEMTGLPLDCFLDGKGMFLVSSSGDDKLYTRNGSFTLSVEDDGNYIVTGRGNYVLDENEERIRLPDGVMPEDVAIEVDGRLTVKGQSESFAKFGIYWFPNPTGLKGEGNSTFTTTEASGEAALMESDYNVVQGFLEASNVDASYEMVTLIKTQRAFSFASRAITTADEMDALANNMRN